jgi:hypothetical protein
MANTTDAPKISTSWEELILDFPVLAGVHTHEALQEVLKVNPEIPMEDATILFQRAHPTAIASVTDELPGKKTKGHTEEASHASPATIFQDDAALMLKDDKKTKATYFDEDFRHTSLLKARTQAWEIANPKATDEERAAFFSTTIINPQDPLDKLCAISRSRSQLDDNIIASMEKYTPETMKLYTKREQKRVYASMEDDPAFRNALLNAKGKTRAVYEKSKADKTPLTDDQLQTLFVTEQLKALNTFAKNNPEKTKAYIEQGSISLRKAASLENDPTAEDVEEVIILEKIKKQKEANPDAEKKREAALLIIQNRITLIKEQTKGGKNPALLSEYQTLLVAREKITKASPKKLDKEIHNARKLLASLRKNAALAEVQLAHEDIAKEAYFISKDNRNTGNDVENWLNAEKALKEQRAAQAKAAVATKASVIQQVAGDEMVIEQPWTDAELAALGSDAVIDELGDIIDEDDDDLLDEEEPFDDTANEDDYDMGDNIQMPQSPDEDDSSDGDSDGSEEDEDGGPNLNQVDDMFGGGAEAGTEAGAEALGAEGAAAGGAEAAGAATAEAGAAAAGAEAAGATAAAGGSAAAGAGAAAAGGAAAGAGGAAAAGAGAAAAPVAAIAAVVIIVLIVLIVLFIIIFGGGGAGSEEPPTDVPAVTINKSDPILSNCDTSNANICDMTYSIVVSFPGSADDVLVTDPLPLNATLVEDKTTPNNYSKETRSDGGTNVVWSMRDNLSGSPFSPTISGINTETYTNSPYNLPKVAMPAGTNPYSDDSIAKLNVLGGKVSRYQTYLLQKTGNNPQYVDPFVSVIWSGAIEGINGNNYFYNCQGKKDINAGCSGGYRSDYWQVGYGVQVSEAVSHIVDDFTAVYGSADAAKVQSIGQQVIINSGGKITNPASFPNKSLADLISEAGPVWTSTKPALTTPQAVAAQQAIAVLLMDPDLSAVSTAVAVAGNISGKNDWAGTMSKWGPNYANNLQRFSERMLFIADRYTGNSGGIFGTQTFKITIRPNDDNTYIINQANAEVINPQSGGGTPQPGNLTEEDAKPSDDNCNVQYDLDLITPLKKNFGDPNCKFITVDERNQLFDVLKQADGDTNARIWFDIIAKCASGYDPNYFFADVSGDPKLDEWGLFGMHASTAGPAMDGKGPDGTYDRGDVQWIKQAKNAVAYNKDLKARNQEWQRWDRCYQPKP